ncbi:Cof-type HAD-IIB family hydrolase [Erysipelotrichaceae bacterium 51-3]|uniref:Cof-type HAD-IIB family hydrolase n=1 Tax=Allobaculum sp. JKK-2023 TaxID=3108943 RepID=UPI002B061758|nr:Cof-type HAD-IIB family hydrolase [Allobaculum sp. JKK-2023]
MYKLVVSDLDETLLTSEKHVGLKTCKAIQQAKKQGTKFVCSTGRGVCSIQGTLKEIGTWNEPGEYSISFNGGMITENKDNKVLALQPLDFDLARDLFNAGQKMNLCVHAYTPDGVYISNINPDEASFLKGRMEYTDLEDIDQLAGQPVLKVLFENSDFESLKPIPARIHALSDQCEVSFSSNRYVEFNPKGINKGSGLRKLAQILGIDLAETIGIGDHLNDAAMIEAAGLGVGVANVYKDVLPLCDVVTSRDHNHDAVAEVLETYVL